MPDTPSKSTKRARSSGGPRKAARVEPGSSTSSPPTQSRETTDTPAKLNATAALETGASLVPGDSQTPLPPVNETAVDRVPKSLDVDKVAGINVPTNNPDKSMAVGSSADQPLDVANLFGLMIKAMQFQCALFAEIEAERKLMRQQEEADREEERAERRLQRYQLDTPALGLDTEEYTSAYKLDRWFLNAQCMLQCRNVPDLELPVAIRFNMVSEPLALACAYIKQCELDAVEPTVLGLKSHLMCRFVLQQDRLRHEIRYMMVSQRDSVEAYFQEFRDAMQYAPVELPERVMIDRFVAGLRGEVRHRFLWPDEPIGSLQEAKRRALSAELMLGIRRN